MIKNLTRQQSMQLFNATQNRRRQLNHIPKVFQELIHFMEYKIRKQTKSFTILSICGGDRNDFSVDAGFQRAFQSMNFQQKIQYYQKSINFAQECSKLQYNMVATKQKIQNQSIKLTIAIIKGFKWEQATIQLQNFKAISDFKIDLRNYLLRKSKKKDKHVYVLQAKKKLLPETIRFAFLSQQDFNRYFPLIRDKVDSAHKQTIEKILSQTKSNKKFNNNIGNTNVIKLKVSDAHQNSKDNVLKEQNIQKQLFNSPLNVQTQIPRLKTSLSQSICQQMMKDKQSQDLDDELQQMVEKQNQQMQQILKFQEKIKQKRKYYKNIFKILFPTYSLNQLLSLHHYKTIYKSLNSDLFIYHSIKNPQVYKMQLKVQLPIQIVCQALYNFNLQKLWHSQIVQGQIKMKITSQNSCIGYTKMKALNQWYRQRDYVFLIHQFKYKNSQYLVTKSIQNTNFIPFQSIIRGNINYMIWNVTQINNICTINMNAHIQYGGLLNINQKNQLTINYLKGFEDMGVYFNKKQNRNKLTKSMGLQWQINDEHNNEYNGQQRDQAMTYRTCDFEESGSQIQQQTVFYTINDSEQDFQFLNQSQRIVKFQKQEKLQQIHEKKLQQIKMQKSNAMITSHVYTQTQQNIQTNDQGIVILPKTYLKKRQPIKPIDTPLKPIKIQYQSGSIVLKDDFALNPKGNLKLINQKRKQAQDSVFKFIMGTLKKNIFSGKGGLNISLPVFIFNIDSALQRTCEALALAPFLMQKAAKIQDQLQRMKYCLALLLSNSIIYFDVQKTFNPILGQTYQGYINGCPIYAQQISHHPPISAFYLVGRGYKIYGNYEAKVKIHLNSGQGQNLGFYHIEFDDGQKVIFQNPPGQLFGMTVGERGFAFKGKGYCINLTKNLFCQLKFQDDSGFFSKNKRKFQDQIQGQLLRVKKQFIDKFLKAEEKKGPGKSDIQDRYYTVGGRWPVQMTIDEEPFYQVNKWLPQKLIHQVNPLNSNSNYRQDLYYRKLNDLAKSQIQKQRLQVIQRNDRKLRQRFHGKKKH